MTSVVKIDEDKSRKQYLSGRPHPFDNSFQVQHRSWLAFGRQARHVCQAQLRKEKKPAESSVPTTRNGKGPAARKHLKMNKVTWSWPFQIAFSLFGRPVGQKSLDLLPRISLPYTQLYTASPNGQEQCLRRDLRDSLSSSF